MTRILNIGSLNVDHAYRVVSLARAGETVSALAYARGPGGKGLNQSTAAARAGASVAHGGCVGQDGQMLVETLAEAGVDVTRVRRVDGPTGHAVIQTDTSGENSIVVYAGANHRLDAAIVRDWLDGFGPGDILLLQHEVNGVAEWVRLGRERRMRVVLNPAPLGDGVSDATLAAIDAIVVNRTEALELAGCGSPAEALDRLTRRAGGAEVIVTLGEDGCLWGRGSDRLAAPAPRVEAVDTTAAGDTFVGYWVAAKAMGRPPEASLDWAVRAAAVSVRRAGAAASIPFAAELEEAIA